MSKPFASYPLSRGVQTGTPDEYAQNGDLNSAAGAYYEPGEVYSIFKQRGRSRFGTTGSSSRIKGLALCKFDQGGIDRLLALSGTAIYSASPGRTGAFTSFVSPVSALAEHFTAVHFDDKYYIGDGIDRNRCLKSDGSLIFQGMLEPPQAPVATLLTGVAVDQRPTTETPGTLFYTNPANARDADSATYAYASRSAAGTVITTWKAFPANAVAGRILSIYWALAGLPPDTAEDPIGGGGGGGGTGTESFSVKVMIEVSENLGAAWRTVYNTTRSSSASNQVVQTALTANNDQVWVRSTFQYLSGTATATHRVTDIKIAASSATPGFDTVSGLYYAVAEYDQVNDIQSPAVFTSKLELSANTGVRLTLGGVQQNTNATHWRIYRTHDGGTKPRDLRLQGTVAITETSYLDDFTLFDKDTPGTLPLPLLKVQPDPDREASYYPINTSPPAFYHLNAYGTFLVGLSSANPRALYYCVPSYPHYWPTIYVVVSFPLKERDELVGTAMVGDSLLVGAAEAMFVVDGLPQASSGVMPEAVVRPMKGQPGCVSTEAIVSYSINGESRAAWVSPFGVHITNGQTAERLPNVSWEVIAPHPEALSKAQLFWDLRRLSLVLIVDADGDGTNDTQWLISMDPDAANAGLPTARWLGPTPVRTSVLAGGMVDGNFLLFAGDESSGEVWLEDDETTGADASQADSGTRLRMNLDFGKGYVPNREWYVDTLSIRHSDFGTDEEASIEWTAGNDNPASESSITKDMALEGARKEDVWIGLMAEWHRIQITHDGTGRGKISQVTMEGGVGDLPGGP